jgi:hypothetical protein
MVTLIVEGAIGNDYIGWVAVRFLVFLLLRANHNQRQLASRLPYFILLNNFLCISRHILTFLVVL